MTLFFEQTTKDKRKSTHMKSKTHFRQDRTPAMFIKAENHGKLL